MASMDRVKLIKKFVRTNPNIVKGNTYYEIKEEDLDFLINKVEELKEVIVDIKDELDVLIIKEDALREYHAEETHNKKSEYFYRGRLAYMRHLRNLLNSEE